MKKEQNYERYFSPQAEALDIKSEGVLCKSQNGSNDDYDLNEFNW